MIKLLQILNYQSHKSTEIELSPGVNVIVGKSDSGKTAILRALRWLIWNRPTGEAFRSWWGGDTKVTIDTESTEIIRLRSDKDNQYIIGNKKLKAIGTDVPEDVQKALHMSDINLQRQLDQPFLLLSTPGEVAAHFNKISKLDKIDSSLRNINREVNSIKSTVNNKKENIEQWTKELKTYDHLGKFEADVEAIEMMEKRQTTLYNSIDSMRKMVTEINQLDVEIEEEEALLQDKNLVNETLELIYKRDGLEDGELNPLIELVDEINKIDDEIEEAEQERDDLHQRFEEEFPSICPLCQKPK